MTEFYIWFNLFLLLNNYVWWCRWLYIYALRLIIKRSVFCSSLLYDMTSIKIPYFITCIIPSCIEIRVNSESASSIAFTCQEGKRISFSNWHQASLWLKMKAEGSKIARWSDALGKFWFNAPIVVWGGKSLKTQTYWDLKFLRLINELHFCWCSLFL